jgi:hypothetical protein
VNGSHVAGGTIAALIAYVSAKFGWNVTTDEALAFSAAFGAIGAGITHLFQPPGLIPKVKAALGLK